MKFFKNTAIATVLVLSLYSCKKDTANNWNVDITKPVSTIEITDISKEFYDPNIPLETFKAKFPWFQGSVPNEDYASRRLDATENRLYKEAITKIDQNKLKKDLSSLFSHIQYYFPQFIVPKVYVYSSALQGIKEPIFYQPEENLLFIDISAFMGENDANYKGLEQYFQKSMNPANIVPKVSEIFAEKFVPYDANRQKFIDILVYQGKLMTVQDAFLPEFPDYLKINYTQKQYDWAKNNEENIWNFIVENDLLYSDDPRLTERFIQPGPFSKFYTEIDNESSPQIGIFQGWQICKKYFKEKPQTKLQDFLKMSAQDIFTAAQYKPKNK